MKRNEEIRLQKMMSRCGVASRRKSEEMILEGKVKVNGEIAEIGDKVDPYKDKVFVNGKRISAASQPKNRYIMLHKPRGFVTTMKDEMGRKCVADLVTDVKERIYPAGRLDRNSEGLLIMTNDGDFAQMITHPQQHINKVYRVTIRPGINEEQIIQMSAGMEIDGYKTAPARVSVITEQENRTVLEIIIREGRNRQIRKMCEQLGIEVARLKRNAIGTLNLGMLQPGKWRDLTGEEIKKLSSIAK